MATISKKVLPEYSDALASGQKKYELRLNDEEINVGDTLLLKEWDEEKKIYTGREVVRKVTYSRVVRIDQLHWPEEEIKAKGLRLLSLE